MLQFRKIIKTHTHTKKERNSGKEEACGATVYSSHPVGTVCLRIGVLSVKISKGRATRRRRRRGGVGFVYFEKGAPLCLSLRAFPCCSSKDHSVKKSYAVTRLCCCALYITLLPPQPFPIFEGTNLEYAHVCAIERTKRKEGIKEERKKERNEPEKVY